MRIGLNRISVIKYIDGTVDLNLKPDLSLGTDRLIKWLDKNPFLKVEKWIAISIDKIVWPKEYKDLVETTEENRIEFAKDFLIKEGLI